MPVPEEIRRVPRPKNTVVYAYGKNKDKYAVKERIGCKRKNGKSYPVNGGTVGHIVDGVYVPIEEFRKQDIHECVSQSDVDIKNWAGEKLIHSLSLHLLDELEEV